MKKLFIGCGIVVFLMSSCAWSNQSRSFPQDITVEDNGILFMSVYVLVEKSGTENSRADNTTDATIDIPLP